MLFGSFWYFQDRGGSVTTTYDECLAEIELTEELAREEGLEIDRVGFESALEQQRAVSRAGAASRFADTVRERADLYARYSAQPTEFLGYTQLEAEGTITGLLDLAQAVDVAEAGQEIGRASCRERV